MSSGPEAAFVLLVLQSMFWLMAGISAVPFAIAGEVFMGGLALATLLLALGTLLVGLCIVWRREWARRVAIAIEAICLFGSAILLLLPIGFNAGPVSLLVNALLPLSVIVLLRKDQEAFS